MRFIHIVACGCNHSLLLMCSTSLCESMPIYLMHSPTDGHLGTL